jgi:hypothetical protein
VKYRFQGSPFKRNLQRYNEGQLAAGLYKLNAVCPYLESAWFQPVMGLCTLNQVDP